MKTDAPVDGPPRPSVARHATLFAFLTVCIDAIGIGIIVPVMPDLLRELEGGSIANAAMWGGYLSFCYAVMQFLFSPLVGNLSDRFGRRPVLLVSLGVLAVDYLIMAMAPTLAVLFVGRVVAGIAAATYSTANAFMADVSAPQERAKNFGLLGAAFGVGFILGPLIGGFVGEYGTRAPFYAAAALAFFNFCYGAIVLPETLRKQNRRAFDWRRANPLGAFWAIRRLPTVAWLMVALFLFNIAHFIYPAIWSYFTKQTFGWSAREIGISLALVGVGFAIVQGALIGPILRRWGQTRTIFFALGFNFVSFSVLAFAREGWMAYAIMPVVALSALLSPALTGLMSSRVSDDAQGELQGAMSSVQSMTLIFSTLLMTQLFAYFSDAAAPVYFPGAPFLLAATLTAMAAVPVCVALTRTDGSVSQGANAPDKVTKRDTDAGPGSDAG